MLDQIVSIYRDYGVALPNDCDLAGHLRLARESIDGSVDMASLVPEEIATRNQNFLSLYHLSFNLKICQEHGIDLRYHLGKLRQGQTIIGRPSSPEEGQHQYKGFFFEVYLISHLLNYRNQVELPERLDDDCADLIVGGSIPIQAYYPSAHRKMYRKIGRFSARLQQRDQYGVLAICLSDAFQISKDGPRAYIQDDTPYLVSRYDELQTIMDEFTIQTRMQDRIIGVAFVIFRPLPVNIPIELDIQHLSIIYENPTIVSEHLETAKNILRWFPPVYAEEEIAAVVAEMVSNENDR